MRVSLLAAAAATCLLTGCPGGQDGPTISTGLKIFVTTERHLGDFGGDTNLPGSTPIEKADAFCNQSVDKPNNSTYKALIVDGTSRDAVSQTDWVLKANTPYYRTLGNVLIGTTNSNAIFDVITNDLPNAVVVCQPGPCDPNDVQVWTGINSEATFAAGSETCLAWSPGANSSTGRFGFADSNDGFAFHSSVVAGCGAGDTSAAHLYCVEQ